MYDKSVNARLMYSALILCAFCLSSKNLHVTGHTNINIDWLSAILRLRSNLPIILQAPRSWKYDVSLCLCRENIYIQTHDTGIDCVAMSSACAKCNAGKRRVSVHADSKIRCSEFLGRGG